MLTDEQVGNAVDQMRSHCRLAMEAFKEGVGEYKSFSAREVLYTLGFSTDEADQVIEALRNDGFTHCIDPMVPTKDVDTGEYRHTPQFACVWGADQLLSRLNCCIHLGEPRHSRHA